MRKRAGETDLGILEAHEDSLSPHLMETEAVLLKGGNVFHIPTNAGWSEGVTGSGTSAQNPHYLSVNTGVTASSTARRYIDYFAGFNLVDTNWLRLNWDKKLYLVFNYRRGGSDSEAIARVQIKETAGEGALSAKGIGIRMDNLALVGESYGTALGSLDLGTALTDGVICQLAIIHYPASKIEWYVNGVLKGIQSTIANIPSGIGGATASLVVSIKNGATGGVNAATQFFLPKIWQAR